MCSVQQEIGDLNLVLLNRNVWSLVLILCRRNHGGDWVNNIYVVLINMISLEIRIIAMVTVLVMYKTELTSVDSHFMV